MAERLFVASAASRGHEAIALSMSTLGLSGRPAAKHAVTALATRGIDLSDHRSQPVRVGLLQRVEHVFVMEHAHVDAIAHRDRRLAARVRLLGELDGGPPEIADPVGQSLEAFERCAARLERCIALFLDQSLGPQ
jgi:protein-tyrosine-phosphatase